MYEDILIIRVHCRGVLSVNICRPDLPSMLLPLQRNQSYQLFSFVSLHLLPDRNMAPRKGKKEAKEEVQVQLGPQVRERERDINQRGFHS